MEYQTSVCLLSYTFSDISLVDVRSSTLRHVAFLSSTYVSKGVIAKEVGKRKELEEALKKEREGRQAHEAETKKAQEENGKRIEDEAIKAAEEQREMEVTELKARIEALEREKRCLSDRVKELEDKQQGHEGELKQQQRQHETELKHQQEQHERQIQHKLEEPQSQEQPQPQHEELPKQEQLKQEQSKPGLLPQLAPEKEVPGRKVMMTTAGDTKHCRIGKICLKTKKRLDKFMNNIITHSGRKEKKKLPHCQLSLPLFLRSTLFLFFTR